MKLFIYPSIFTMGALRLLAVFTFREPIKIGLQELIVPTCQGGRGLVGDLGNAVCSSPDSHFEYRIVIKGTVQRKLTGVESDINRKDFISH